MEQYKDFGNGYVEEIVAPKLGIDWNFANNTAWVRFQMDRLATVNGELRSQSPVGLLEHFIDPANNPKTYRIPVVGSTGQQEYDELGYPIYMDQTEIQLMATIKACFIQLFEEKYNSSLEPPTFADV